jgi:hypothetical protein
MYVEMRIYRLKCIVAVSLCRSRRRRRRRRCRPWSAFQAVDSVYINRRLHPAAIQHQHAISCSRLLTQTLWLNVHLVLKRAEVLRNLRWAAI